MATYNRYNQPNSMYQFGQNPNRMFQNKLLRTISNFGGNYDDMVARNSMAIGAFEDSSNLLAGGDPATQMYDIFTKKIISKVLEKKSIAYLDRSYLDKRKILRQYSIKDEIKDYVTRVCDESIIFDENNYFCSVKDLPETFDQSIRDKFQENFKRLYDNLGFSDGITAWNYLKNFLIDGFLAYEIVYDDKQRNIIDLNLLDPLTLVVATEPGTSIIVWIQNPDVPQLRRVLLDANIIYLAYSNSQEYDEASYVEGLIKPYNQLKLLEQTKLMYNINQASIYKKFIIPTDGLTKQQAEQQIYRLMSEYHEDIDWDDQLGTVTINGSAKIPHSKDYWFPKSENGSPEIEIIQPVQADLNEDQVLNWFFRNLKRASKLPPSRFDEESGGGGFYDDTSSITRDEIRFKNFVTRIRTLFKEIVLKPLKIQMILDFPELQDEPLFNSSMRLEFNSNDLFEEWKHLNNLAKRSDIASTLLNNLQDQEGMPYLSIEWIIRNIMKFTEEDIQENNRYKLQGGGATPGEGGGGGGEDFGGGGEDFGGGGEGGFGGEDFGGGGEDFGQAQAQGGGGEDFGESQAQGPQPEF